MAKRTATEAFRWSVKTARKRRDWNQQQLAERLTELGVPTAQSTVARLEKGQRGVSLDEAVALGVALDVSLAHLIGGPAVEGDEIALTPTEVLSAELTRTWIAGDGPSLHTGPDMGLYYTFKSRAEMERFWQNNPNAPTYERGEIIRRGRPSDAS